MDLELADFALMTENPIGAYGREFALLMRIRRGGSKDIGIRGGGGIVMAGSPYMGFSMLIGTDAGLQYWLRRISIYPTAVVPFPLRKVSARAV